MVGAEGFEPPNGVKDSLGLQPSATNRIRLTLWFPGLDSNQDSPVSETGMLPVTPPGNISKINSLHMAAGQGIEP